VRVDNHEAGDLDDAARNRLVVGLDAPVLETFAAVDLLLLHPVVVTGRTREWFRDNSVFERPVDDHVMLFVDRANVGAPAAQIVAFQAPALTYRKSLYAADKFK